MISTDGEGQPFTSSVEAPAMTRRRFSALAWTAPAIAIAVNTPAIATSAAPIVMLEIVTIPDPVAPSSPSNGVERFGPLVVRAVDQFGAAHAGVAVSFSVLSGPATIAGTTSMQTTDSSGFAVISGITSMTAAGAVVVLASGPENELLVPIEVSESGSIAAPFDVFLSLVAGVATVKIRNLASVSLAAEIVAAPIEGLVGATASVAPGELRGLAVFEPPSSEPFDVAVRGTAGSATTTRTVRFFYG